MRYLERIYMPLFVRDAEVDALVEQLASIKGRTKTETVREAHELERERGQLNLAEQSAEFARRLKERAGPRAIPADKAFVDALYEDH